MSQQSDLTQKPLARIQENVLASSERRLLTWLCAHMPAWVTPDVLTATGMVGALAIFVGYAASGLSPARSEEHTSELQSLMRNSYAVFCLQKKKNNHNNTTNRGKTT